VYGRRVKEAIVAVVLAVEAADDLAVHFPVSLRDLAAVR